MRFKFFLFLTLLACGLALAACAGQATPAPADTGAAPADEQVAIPDYNSQLPQAWLPADNWCTFAGTGATVASGGERATFTCAPQDGQETVLLGDPTPGDDFWMLNRAPVTQGDNGATVGTSESVGLSHIVLDDGTLCAWAGSGATLGFDDKRMNFTCNTESDGQETVLLGDIQMGDAGWQIERGVMRADASAENGYVLESSQMATIQALGITAP